LAAILLKILKCHSTYYLFILLLLTSVVTFANLLFMSFFAYFTWNLSLMKDLHTCLLFRFLAELFLFLPCYSTFCNWLWLSRFSLYDLSQNLLFIQEFMHVYTVPMHSQTLHKRLNRLILIILQCNTEHKNIFLHYDIPGLKIKQIKIPRNVVDDVGWHIRPKKKYVCLRSPERPYEFLHRIRITIFVV
jgi:hypothetical protein